jgi:hypothetical protein
MVFYDYGAKDSPQPGGATIDHLRSRLSPNRTEPNPDHEERTVLAHFRCNQQRATEEQAALPLEEKRRRSGRPKSQQESA